MVDEIGLTTPKKGGGGGGQRGWKVEEEKEMVRVGGGGRGFGKPEIGDGYVLAGNSLNNDFYF